MLRVKYVLLIATEVFNRGEAMYISSVLVQRQRNFNSLIVQYLIIITYISNENIFAKPVTKHINIAPF